MTQEGILEGNKLIADFMEVRLHSRVKQWQVAKGVFYKELHYHSSWDWLMPSFYKFRDETKVNIGLQGILTNYIAQIAERIAFGEITQVYKKLVEAITWYNNSQTPK